MAFRCKTLHLDHVPGLWLQKMRLLIFLGSEKVKVILEVSKADRARTDGSLTTLCVPVEAGHNSKNSKTDRPEVELQFLPDNSQP